MSVLDGRSVEDLTVAQWRGLADDADAEGTEYEQFLVGLVSEYAPDEVAAEFNGGDGQ